MKKKLKGLLSLWLAVVLVLVTTAVPVRAEGSHGKHSSESGWQDLLTAFATDEYTHILCGNYYLESGYTLSGSQHFQVTVGSSAAICLNGKKLKADSSGYINVYGELTMDDCSANPGTCSVPIYFQDNDSILDIRGGKYTGDIKNDNYNVTCNIGVNAGSHTQVQIADIKQAYEEDYYEPVPKIEGNFNLLNPTPNYYTRGNTTMVFAGWAVSLDADTGGTIITDTAIKTISGFNWSEIENQYSSVWADRTEGSIYLADRWAEGHTVTYDYSDGATPDKTVGVVSGESITLETPSAISGHIFDCWKADSSSQKTYKAGESFTPKENTTLTAQWKKVHTVTYKYDDGSTADGMEDVVSGKAITLVTPTREGYTFDGWKAEPGERILTGGALFKPEENTTLTAQWKKVHTVTYKYNGGSTADKTVNVVSGESITLETPPREGYTFDGWKEDSSGLTYKGGFPFKPEANTTLTAQWTKKSGGSTGGSTSSSGSTGGSTSSGDNTVTPPSNNPDNNSNKDTKTTDWNSVKSDVTNAKDGDTVTVDLSKDTTVPGGIFDSIRGKDVTLVLNLGNGMSWKINGNSITADKVADINFSVDFDSKTIPVEVINKVSGERYTMRLSLAHNGPFGFEAVLSVNLDAKNAGLYANLFYFNPETQELEFAEDDIITDQGTAEFTFTHASDYAIIIDKASMAPSIPAKGTEVKKGTELTDQKTGAVYKVTRAGKTGGTVAYMGSTDKKATKIVIPATVTIDGITYKVTSIGAKAFEKNKTVQEIIIGKNVEKIGKKAFFGCRNLKKIVIRTTRLTDETVGSKAFQKIAAKAKIRVPEEKLDTYIKLLAAKGLGDKAVVKK